MKIQGEKVTLIPIKPKDKNEFYKLATKTHGATFWYDDEERGKRKFIMILLITGLLAALVLGISLLNRT